jgi:hypothetical protein
MPERIDITPYELAQLLHYNPETGVLTWLPRGEEWCVSDRDCARWNSRHAGKEAFTCVGKLGYKSGSILSRPMKAHRAAWALHYGKWPDGKIDHIDHDKTNNRIDNLRDVSQAENNKNASKRLDNSSGATGVCLSGGKWRARIDVDGRRVHLGRFACIDDAVAARKNAEILFGFHKNHGKDSR